MVLNDYEYDIYGNRTAQRRNGEEIRYFYNDVNQLIRREGESGIQDYLYDANGNLTQVMQADRILAEYRYDSADHMVFAKTGNGIAEYGYNGFGKKISMEVKHPETGMSAGPDRTDYILDYTRDYNNLSKERKIRTEQRRISGTITCYPPHLKQNQTQWMKSSLSGI